MGTDATGNKTDVETRVCRECGERKPINFFVKKASRKSNGYELRRLCTPCESRKKVEEARKQGKNLHIRAVLSSELSKSEYARHKKLRRYGLTIEDYKKMYEEQHGKCAICKLHETVIRNGKRQLLSVDHNHSTGEVRQLLCISCNRSLHAVERDSDWGAKAKRYLAKHEPGGLPDLLDIG